MKEKDKKAPELSKKEQAEHDRALREANHAEHAFHFEVHGVKQIRVALHFIPIFQKIIMGCFVISGLLAGLSVWEYFNRNPAMLFLSMPDGSLRCPLKTFNIETKKLYERPEEYEALCNRLQGVNAVLSETPEPNQPRPEDINQTLESKESNPAESSLNTPSLSTKDPLTVSPVPASMTSENQANPNPAVTPESIKDNPQNDESQSSSTEVEVLNRENENGNV